MNKLMGLWIYLGEPRILLIHICRCILPILPRAYALEFLVQTSISLFTRPLGFKLASIYIPIPTYLPISLLLLSIERLPEMPNYEVGHRSLQAQRFLH